MAPSCENMLSYCEFGHKSFNCSKMFRRILTDDGLCCNFNGIGSNFMMKNVSKSVFAKKIAFFSNLMNLDIYEDNCISFLPIKFFRRIGTERDFWSNCKWMDPWNGIYFKRTEIKSKSLTETSNWYFYDIICGSSINLVLSVYHLGSGNEMGLTLILNTDMNDYFCSSTRSYGFKVLLNSPNDLPRVSRYGIAVPNGYESRLVIQPTITEASDDVRKISPKIRRCIFESENFLDIFRWVNLQKFEILFETTNHFNVT